MRCPALENGMAIFFLTKGTHKVVAISPNFRMKWPFLDGTTQTNRYHGVYEPKNRPQFGYQPEEALEGKSIQDTKLTPRQRMFGYTYQDNCKQPGKKKTEYLEAYAGRVQFNFAVHQPDTGRIYDGPWTLPILGQPKPSSYEHYLRPYKDELVTDYRLPHRDTDPVPHLAGRKHYLHQPLNQVKKGESSVKNPGQNGTLLTHLRWDWQKPNPFPIFRFTVRFTRLAKWEIGLLYRVLNISETRSPNTLVEPIEQPLIQGNIFKELQLRAVKLGYARPLGWGSTMSQVQSLRITETFGQAAKAIDDSTPFLTALDKKMDAWFPEGEGKPFWEKTFATRALDMLSRFRWPDFTNQAQDYDYPRRWRIDSKGKETKEIYAYHMELHKHHLDQRMNSPEGVETPMPHPEKVWEEAYENNYSGEPT